jgi:copper chaperone CopZ
MKTLITLAFLLSFAGALFGADEKPAQPQTVVHRVTGLFDSKREAELRMTLANVPDVELVSIDFEHAEGIFRYDAAKAFPGTKPEDVIKRFDEKLRSVSAGTFGIKPLSTTPHEKLQRIEIPIIGLDCRACGLAAYEAVAKLDGVEQATASFHDGRVTALIDPEKTDRAKLETALKEKRVTLAQP